MNTGEWGAAPYNGVTYVHKGPVAERIGCLFATKKAEQLVATTNNNYTGCKTRSGAICTFAPPCLFTALPGAADKNLQKNHSLLCI